MTKRAYFFIAAATFFKLSIAGASPGTNAICSTMSSSGEGVRGTHIRESFEIASVSKLFTTDWALRRLGPHFRFQTLIRVTPVDAGVTDVHIVGSQDPFWGRQMTHFLFQQLNQLGIRHIKTLSFDENLRFRWNVLQDASGDTLHPGPEEIQTALVHHLKNLKAEYAVTMAEAQKAQLPLPPQLNLTVDEVRFISRGDAKSSPETRSYVLKSTELTRILKQMNSTSNNQVADDLYDFLGGSENFQKYARARFHLAPDEMVFVNGSGDSVIEGEDSSGKPLKRYNKASCESLIQVLVDLRRDLRKQGLDLSNVMAVAKSDPDSTLGTRYDALENSLVGKTGTVDPAVNLVGMLSTAQGDVYFGILMRTEGPADWEKARDHVRDQVFEWASQKGGAKAFSYKPGPSFMPFDAKSKLLSVSPKSPGSLAISATP